MSLKLLINFVPGLSASLMIVSLLCGEVVFAQSAQTTLGVVGVGGSAGSTPSIRSVDAQVTTGGVAQSGLQQAPLEPLKPNDFQKFVFETTGIKLPLFGHTFFDNLQQGQRQASAISSGLAPVAYNPFAPVDNAPVTPDYVLGPGDQMVVRGWGSVEIDVRSTIDRNGMISIPRVGSIPLAGVRAGQAEGVLRNAIGKYFRDFHLSVTTGQLRSITVYVVGQARRPGSYALSNVATLSSSLFASGGPNANGSVRRVQLKRGGQTVTEFDLYSFLSQGNNLSDAKLIDGDVIFIPPASGYVAIAGKVNSPAVYELKDGNETFEQLLSVAGGLPVVADRRLVTLERISPDQTQPRSVVDVALDERGFKTQLKNGDMITVHGISAELGNAIALRGNVAQPRRVAWREGMRVRDLIPNREALISRESIRRQNEVLFDVAQRERTQREREMVAEDLLDDKEINDRIMKDPRYAGRNIPGQNQAQPTKPQSNQGGQGVFGGNAVLPDVNDLESYKERRQLRLFSSLAPIEIKEKNEVPSVTDLIGNLFDEINWDYALIERINRQDLSVTLIPFDLARVLSDVNDPDNQLLKPGDVVTVFSAADMRVPVSKRRIMVRIEGEVVRPGIYQAKPGETLTTVLQRAGGLTHEAYLYGANFYREEVRKSQVDNLQKLLRRLESESAAKVAMIGQNMGASSDSNLIQSRMLAVQQAQKQALDRVRNLRPEGRIALGLVPELNNYINKLPEIRWQNGDRFVVPSRPDFVYIYGAVNTESAQIYKPNRTVKDYLALAGMSQAADKDAVIVVRADGSAITTNDSWFGSVQSVKLMPGDALVVPEKADMEGAWSAWIRNTKDITQIFYQLGLGAAGLKALGY